MHPSESCPKRCENYRSVSIHFCLAYKCSPTQQQCRGRARNCQSIDSELQVCLSVRKLKILLIWNFKKSKSKLFLLKVRIFTYLNFAHLRIIDYPSLHQKKKTFKGSFSCKWVKKSIFFFHHYSIAYAFTNTHVKFQAGIRKIVEVMNFFVTSCSTSGFWN